MDRPSYDFTQLFLNLKGVFKHISFLNIIYTEIMEDDIICLEIVTN